MNKPFVRIFQFLFYRLPDTRRAVSCNTFQRVIGKKTIAGLYAIGKEASEEVSTPQQYNDSCKDN